jgi:hypothetical protein
MAFKFCRDEATRESYVAALFDCFSVQNIRVIQPTSIENSLSMGVMMLPESSFAFFALVFMNKYHRVRAQRSRWE